MRTSSLALSLFALAASGTGQTYTVDASGVASPLTTIQAALDIAVHGDSIHVLPGLYNEDPATDQGVFIHADPGARLTSFDGMGFRVTGVPAGETFTLRGLEVVFAILPIGGVHVAACQGAVLLEDLMLPAQIQVWGPVSVVDSAQVSIGGLHAWGFPALNIDNSHVILSDCDVTGSGFISALPSVLVQDSTVTIVGGIIRGAIGSLSPTVASIHADNSTLRIAGRDTVVEAGIDMTISPTSAILATNSLVEYDPAVTFVTQDGGPPVSGGATEIVRVIPSVRGDGLASFGTWDIDLHAPTGDAYCLFFGFPAPLVPTPWGDVWFDPTSLIATACGVVGPGDQVARSLALPVLPSGLPIVVQGAVAPSIGLTLTLPVVNVVE